MGQGGLRLATPEDGGVRTTSAIAWVQMSEDRTRSVAPRALDSSARLRLIVFCGGQVSSHPVPRAGELVLGRGEDAHVRIDHVTVSRKHATIIVGEALTIVDHGSFNGTSIGGRKIAPNTPASLGIATIAELGETMVVLQVEGPDTVTGLRGLSAAAPPRTQTSAAMQHLYRLIDNVAQSNITVIVRGETGAGKEVVAEEIHRRSPRAHKSLVKLNCAALPEHLLEGELFGYERGAFTGATAAKPGLIEVADGGTLFLDEVGELPRPPRRSSSASSRAARCSASVACVRSRSTSASSRRRIATSRTWSRAASFARTSTTASTA